MEHKEGSLEKKIVRKRPSSSARTRVDILLSREYEGCMYIEREYIEMK